MGLAQRLVSNSLHNAVGRVWVIILTLALTAYTVHKLGNEHFALWAVMLAIINYASVIDMGTGHAFAKFVAEYRARGDHQGLSGVVTGGFFFYLIGSLAVCTVCWFQEPWFFQVLRIPAELRVDFQFVFRVTLACFVAQHVANALRSVLFGIQRIDVMRSIWVWTTVFQGVAAVVALEMGTGIRGLAVSHAAFVLVTGIVTLRAAVRLCPEMRFSLRAANWPLLKRMITFGMKLQVISIANVVHIHVDKFLLTAYTGLQFTAFYELGRRAARAVGTLPHLIPDVVMPAVSEIDTHGDRERIRQLYREGSRCVALVTIPLVGAVLATAPWIVLAWVGTGYEWAAVCLAVIVVTYGFQVLTGMGTSVVRGMGRPDIEMWNRIGMVTAHVVLSALLVKQWGLVGVLVGLGISSLLGDGIFLFSIHRFLEYPLRHMVRDVLVRPATATAVATALTFVAGRWLAGQLGDPGRANALIVLAVQGVIYAALLLPALWATRAVGEQEWRIVRGLVKAFREGPEGRGGVDEVQDETAVIEAPHRAA